MRKVIGIGETILDVIFQNNQPYKAVPGGSTFNCMISLGRLKVPSIFISELGKDRIGDLIKEFMRENNLSSDYIYFFEEGKSPVSMAFLSETKDAEYIFYKDFPKKRLDIFFPEIEKEDIVVIGSYFAVDPLVRKQVSHLLHIAKEKEALIYYDINFRKPHAHERSFLMKNFNENFYMASIIRCSDEDLEVLFPGLDIEDIYKQYIAPYGKAMVITKGERGMVLRTPFFTKLYEVSAVVPLSTIGAGDNFNAGFIYGLLSQKIVLKDLHLLPEEKWDSLIYMGQRFASQVCLSYDNYISVEFAANINAD